MLARSCTVIRTGARAAKHVTSSVTMRAGSVEVQQRCMSWRDKSLADREKIYEFRTYTAHPEHFPEFLKLTNEKIHMRTAHSKLLGYWTTEIGGQNEVVHLWEYDTLTHRQGVRAALVQDKPWNEQYMSKMRGMLQKQDNILLRGIYPEHKFLDPDTEDAMGVYEVHFNYLKPHSVNEMVKKYG